VLENYKSNHFFVAVMKYIWLVLLALMLAVPAVAQEPYVQDGRIVATIVVGEDAPATDVILGAQVASYLQRFATEVRFGLAVTTREIPFSHNAPLILIGTPEDNPFVADQLDIFSNTDLSGPLVVEQGNRLVLTGRNDAEVEQAADAFVSGRRSLGTLPRQQLPIISPPESLPEVVSEPSAPVFVEPTQPRLPECEQARFCRGADVMVINTECQEVVHSTCPGLCRDGECVVSASKPSFWKRFVGALAFWR